MVGLMGLLEGPRRVNRLEGHYVTRNLVRGFQLMTQDRVTLLSFFFLLSVLFLGVFGPSLTPYEYDQSNYGEDGQLERLEQPSLEHPLGTDQIGRDVFSRVLYGARPTVITGLLGGTLIMLIGTTIGLVSGYFGGWVDEVLMRFTDVMYSVPLIPLAIVLVGILNISFLSSIIVLGLILWRGGARVLRAQVLQIKERPFILSAQATGASRTTVILKHILPNVATMAIFFFALGVGEAILIQAGLAFVGVVDPFVPSWGVMLRNAYQSGLITEVWWWAMPPGLMISMTVASAILFGRGYENVSKGSDESQELIVEAEGG